MRVLTLLAVLVLGACAPAVRESPPSVGELAAGPAADMSAEELLQQSERAWQRRAEPGQARVAEELALQAAAADGSRVDALAAAIRAKTFRVEREQDRTAREQLALSAVEIGQVCRKRAPQAPLCAYWLAVALGQATRERPTTAKNTLPTIVALLRESMAGDEKLDRAGPHRVLAMLLVRAPGWPLGPGDPEAALEEAWQAATLFGDFAPNQLALAEAQAKTGDGAAALLSYGRAQELARAASRDGDPDAERWESEASAGTSAVRRSAAAVKIPLDPHEWLR